MSGRTPAAPATPHPRIWVDIEALRAKKLGREAFGGSAPGLALASIAVRDASLCDAAYTKVGSRLDEQALVYDWCHDALSPLKRAALRVSMTTAMGASMRNRRQWRSFHNAGHTAAYELTLAALALAGDDPIADDALAFLRPELDDMLATFDQVFPDGAWGEGADYARHASQLGLRTFLALRDARMQTSPHLRNVANYIFHASKPDGLLFDGDDDDYPFVSSWEHVALLISAHEYGDPHAEWALRHWTFPQFALSERDKWAEALWGVDIPEAPLDTLPKSRLFPGKGLVFARSGWDEHATWISFTNGDYFGDHDHFDVNAFQIHYRGHLAIDSGRYDDDWDFVGDAVKVSRSQLFEYYQRTIAHNTMLVRDPNESFGAGHANDGGQRILLTRDGHRNVPEDYAQGNFPSDDGRATCDWATNLGRWERGDITAYLATPDFTFVRGDGTKAYAASKLSSFVRELLFVPPRLVVVRDHVVSTNPSFEKTWLLHTIDEPRIGDDWFEVKQGEGRLVGRALGAMELRVVPSKGPQLTEVARPLHFGEMPGAWRIEETPKTPALDDHFVNVMLTTDASSDERPVIEEGDVLRVREGDRVVELGIDTLRITRAHHDVFDGRLPARVVR